MESASWRKEPESLLSLLATLSDAFVYWPNSALELTGCSLQKSCWKGIQQLICVRG